MAGTEELQQFAVGGVAANTYVCSCLPGLWHCCPQALWCPHHFMCPACPLFAAAITWRAPRMQGALTTASSTRRVVAGSAPANECPADSGEGLQILSCWPTCRLSMIRSVPHPAPHLACLACLCLLVPAGGVPHPLGPVPSRGQAAVAVSSKQYMQGSNRWL